MAILTALLSALTRKLGSLIQAIMGWSVAALFGRLTPARRLAVSVAMILSVLWPIFVLGVFFPSAAGVLVAFIPLKELLGDAAIRTIWVALAVVAPLIVGALVHVAAGARSRSLSRMLVNGYPLALGFAISFVVTVVTVPLIKLASLARGWSDEHVYVQAKPGRYQEALKQVARACVYAGLVPEVTRLPRSMSLATEVIKFFARGGLDALIADDPKRVRAPGLELYLYPGDLLLRGEEHRVTRVRAALGYTLLEQSAWLVEGPRAQQLQDELGRLWDALQRHEDFDDATGALDARLREIAADSTKPGISYGDWVMVDRITRKVEAKLQHHDGVGERSSRQLAEKAAVRTDNPASVARATRPAIEGATTDASPRELIEAALAESKELVKLEVALAKVEVKKQLKEATRAAIGFGVAAVLAIVALALFAVAVVLALGGSPVNAVLTAVVVLVIAAGAAWFGYAQLPKEPLPETRHHVEDDLKQLKEHLA